MKVCIVNMCFAAGLPWSVLMYAGRGTVETCMSQVCDSSKHLLTHSICLCDCNDRVFVISYENFWCYFDVG